MKTYLILDFISLALVVISTLLIIFGYSIINFVRKITWSTNDPFEVGIFISIPLFYIASLILTIISVYIKPNIFGMVLLVISIISIIIVIYKIMNMKFL
jgi:hypothetical protein